MTFVELYEKTREENNIGNIKDLLMEAALMEMAGDKFVVKPSPKPRKKKEQPKLMDQK